jgi:adenine-specific DNA-methyltransferase
MNTNSGLYKAGLLMMADKVARRNKIPMSAFNYFGYLIDRIPVNELLHLPGCLHENLLSHTDRKKQGSYYTPVSLVRYMVRKSFDNTFSHAPEPGNLAIIDPACGGGAFLLETFRYLVEQDFSVEQALDSLYGIDIDPLAVEVCIFILTIEIMAKNNHMLDPEQIVNRLKEKIITGNSLETNNFTPRNGFDIIIGNPPYVANKLIPINDKKFYREKYKTAVGQYDLSILFLEQGFNLASSDGTICFLTSNKFLASDYGKELRKELLSNYRIIELFDVSTLKSFKDTAVYPVIIIVKKTKPNKKDVIKLFKVSDIDDLQNITPVEVKQGLFFDCSEYIISTEINNENLPLVYKIMSIKGRIPRKNIRCGLALTGFNKWICEHEADNCKKFIQSGDIAPYFIKKHTWINTDSFNSKRAIKEAKHRKLVIPGIAKSLMSAIESSEALLGRIYYIKEDEATFELSYLNTLFNSYLLRFFYRIMYWPVHLEGGYLRFNSGYISNLPLFSLWDIKHLGDREGSCLIEELTILGRELECSNLSAHKKTRLMILTQALVFKLYGFNDQEAGTVMEYLNIPNEISELIKNSIREV